MAQEALGNLFEKHRQGSLLCLIELKVGEVIATERTTAAEAKPYSLSIPLRADNISLEGDEKSQILISSDEGARLYLERGLYDTRLKSVLDKEALGKLESEGKRAVSQMRRSKAILLGALVSFLLVLVVAYSGVNFIIGMAVDRIPVSWESSLGEVVASNFAAEEITDSRVTEPVQAVLDHLVRALGEQPYDFKLHVVKNSEINALAAPGGQVVVYSGLLEQTDSPEQLAGVLSHEIQHVIGRHGLQAMAHSLKWQIITAVLLGDLSAAEAVLLTNGSRFMSLSYSRSLEDEADIEGGRLLVKAGIDPRALADFFGLLQASEGAFSKVPSFLLDHPKTAARIKAVNAFAEKQKGQAFAPLPIDWSAMKGALSSI